MDTHVDDAGTAGTNGSARLEAEDFVHTGPGTLAGRYLRRFWQPLYPGHDLKPGWSVPVRILGQDLTLYRGETGTPFAVGPRCAHRGVQLSTGIVEGDCIRCPYHAWKYDGSGQCTEQPNTPNSFAHAVQIPNFPIVERLGLIFVYLGDGEPPAPPYYPDFENAGGTFQHMNTFHDFNYFQHLENSVNEAHIPVLHKLSPYGPINFEVPWISAEETEFGIAQYGTRTTGVKRATYFHMPNMSSWAQHPIYPEETAWREWMGWRVPVDDQSHRMLGVMHAHVAAGSVPAFLEHRKQEAADLAKFPPTDGVADAVLSGRTRWRDVELRGNGTDMTLIQDRVAMLGQGVIPDRSTENLGSNDVAIVLLRRIWKRELQALRDGRPLKQWARSIPLCESGLGES